MGKGASKMAGLDFGRRLVTVFGAVLQVVVGFFVPVGSLVNRDVSLIIPAGWAFAIWGPIFLLCAVYAVYQALPSRRYDPLLRRIGWPLGLAFVGNGVWTLVQPLRQPVLSEAVILVVLVLAVVAFVRFVRSAEVEGLQHWVVGLPLGLLTGWLTAASVVGFNDMLVREGVIGGGMTAALVGAGLLLFGALVAYVVLLAGASGPWQSSVTYALGVVWGLFGIAANQYDTSVITTLVSVVCLVALVVVAARLVTNSGGRVQAKRVS